MLKNSLRIHFFFLLLTFPSLFLFSESPFTKVGKEENPATFSGSFSKIKASGGFNIHLIPANESKVVIDCPPEVQEQANVEIDHDTLHIRFKDGTFFSSGAQAICASIYFENLTDLELIGPIQLTAEGAIRLAHLTLDKVGSGSLELNVDVNQLTLMFKGNSKILLKGEVDDLVLTALKSTLFDGSNLIAKSAKVIGSGSSKITLHANENLKVHLSGQALLRYNGHPSISLDKVSGRSRIERAN